MIEPVTLVTLIISCILVIERIAKIIIKKCKHSECFMGVKVDK